MWLLVDLSHLIVFAVSSIMISVLLSDIIWRVSQKVSRRACDHRAFYNSCVDCRLVSRKADSVTAVVIVIVIVICFILTKRLFIL